MAGLIDIAPGSKSIAAGFITGRRLMDIADRVDGSAPDFVSRISPRVAQAARAREAISRWCNALACIGAKGREVVQAPRGIYGHRS